MNPLCSSLGTPNTYCSYLPMCQVEISTSVSLDSWPERELTELGSSQLKPRTMVYFLNASAVFSLFCSGLLSTISTWGILPAWLSLLWISCSISEGVSEAFSSESKFPRCHDRCSRVSGLEGVLHTRECRCSCPKTVTFSPGGTSMGPLVERITLRIQTSGSLIIN